MLLNPGLVRLTAAAALLAAMAWGCGSGPKSASTTPSSSSTPSSCTARAVDLASPATTLPASPGSAEEISEPPRGAFFAGFSLRAMNCVALLPEKLRGP